MLALQLALAHAPLLAERLAAAAAAPPQHRNEFAARDHYEVSLDVVTTNSSVFDTSHTALDFAGTVAAGVANNGSVKRARARR